VNKTLAQIAQRSAESQYCIWYTSISGTFARRELFWRVPSIKGAIVRAISCLGIVGKRLVQTNEYYSMAVGRRTDDSLSLKSEIAANLVAFIFPVSAPFVLLALIMECLLIRHVACRHGNQKHYPVKHFAQFLARIQVTSILQVQGNLTTRVYGSLTVQPSQPHRHSPAGPPHISARNSRRRSLLEAF
jgi:hypothetical protein